MRVGGWYEARQSDQEEPFTFQVEKVDGKIVYIKAGTYRGPEPRGILNFSTYFLEELRPVDPPFVPEDGQVMVWSEHAVDNSQWVRLSGKWWMLDPELRVLEDSDIRLFVDAGHYKIQKEPRP